MRFLALIFVIIVIAFIVGFMMLNLDHKVDIDIFGKKIMDVPVAMLSLYSFIAGMLFVFIFALADGIVLRSNLHRLNREHRALRKELDALRNLPFEEGK
ncbi:hypothetical protein A2Y85_02975 [candidate division WOR-3 bacterium RBG_13_43_14]|uniref:Lipopolysaccharide assembly protein A domain-containing protein n=1 Tax=candidate division WOR-3 bacterium RBG_13_43_14 TaxID=1802590 RepID=A0A1F4UDW2_UNCW3|nr:MAG: hypothetical protein A2Y85_02975 [candidate division WOR-3 bacterium RBG_13_43_14]